MKNRLNWFLCLSFIVLAAAGYSADRAKDGQEENDSCLLNDNDDGYDADLDEEPEEDAEEDSQTVPSRRGRKKSAVTSSQAYHETVYRAFRVTKIPGDFKPVSTKEPEDEYQRFIRCLEKAGWSLRKVSVEK